MKQTRRRSSAGKAAMLAVILAGAHAAGAQQFTNATAAANLTWPDDGTLWRQQVLNAGWIDVDSDGYFDLFVSPHGSGATGVNNLERRSIVFHNNGNGTFTLQPYSLLKTANDSHETMWADYDNDGDPDFFLQNGGQSGSGEPTPRTLMRNDAGVFVSIATEVGLSPRIGSGRGCLWFDWDKDGKLDLCLFNANINSLGNYAELMQQTTNGFVKRNTEAGFVVPGYSTFGTVSDIFGDGKPDLVVFGGQANDFGIVARVFENATTNLVDRKAELPAEAGAANGRDVVVADFNGDLIPDFLIVTTPDTFNSATNLSALPANITNQLQAPVYIESSPTGYHYRSAAAGFTNGFYGMAVGCGDFDNDGDLDVYMAGQVGLIGVPPRYFQNDGNGVFTEVTNANGATYPITGPIQRYDQQCGMAFCVGDYNNDGCLDIYSAMQLSKSETTADLGVSLINIPARLFKNLGNSNHWIELNLVGTDSNRDAIGAKVILTAGGKSQLREQTGMMRRLAQDMKRLHFGLGAATNVTSLEIHWPNGQVQIVTNITANQIVTITEPDTPALYEEWATRAGLPGDHTGLGDPAAAPAQDGIPNLIKYALGLNPFTNGYQGRFSHQWVTAGGSNYFALTFTRPDPAPAGISFYIEFGDTPLAFPDAGIEQSNTFNAPLRTLTFRDPVNRAAASRRFGRLRISLP